MRESLTVSTIKSVAQTTLKCFCVASLHQSRQRVKNLHDENFAGDGAVVAALRAYRDKIEVQVPKQWLPAVIRPRETRAAFIEPDQVEEMFEQQFETYQTLLAPFKNKSYTVQLIKMIELLYGATNCQQSIGVCGYIDPNDAVDDEIYIWNGEQFSKFGGYLEYDSIIQIARDCLESLDQSCTASQNVDDDVYRQIYTILTNNYEYVKSKGK